MRTIKIYQTRHLIKDEIYHTTYIGPDREKAFSSNFNNAYVSVWVNGIETEYYSRESGEWTLKHDEIDLFKSNYKRLKIDAKLENPLLKKKLGVSEKFKQLLHDLKVK